jgi:nitrogen fixation/metabolism regulation signal transduction histidine kinase
MKRLRNRLLAAFLAATLAPLCVSLWVTASLLEHSLDYAPTRELDELSKALEKTGREFYQQARESLRRDADTGRLSPRLYAAAGKGEWPAEVAEFWESGDAARFRLAGESGNRLDYLLRRRGGVAVYSRDLGAVRMSELTSLYSSARARVESSRVRDLRRGFLLTMLVAAAGVAVLMSTVLSIFAHRIAKPVKKLTGALERLASGDLSVRVTADRRDEIGLALEAFNRMAEQLEHSRERLILLTRLESWQAVGRKMAHEVKNSLTPIRLTVEEMMARQSLQLDAGERAFFEQAGQIIIDEVTRLERRVRAFSDLAAEPPVRITEFPLNTVLEERIGFLRAAHPEVIYDVRVSSDHPVVTGDEDLVRGVLTNLLENAAEAAGPGGVVKGSTRVAGSKGCLEVHDSGPGLSLHARETLFLPTISFKKSGMGLGLSIARKSALLSGGNIELIASELGGAAFRVTLPLAAQTAESAAGIVETSWAPSES